MKKTALILAFVLFFSSPSYAATASPWTKLGRGLGNIAFGWAEVFRQMGEMGRTERWPIAVAGGLFKGVFYGIGRTAVGVYETLTFPFPVPEDYRVIMEPDFVIPKA